MTKFENAIKEVLIEREIMDKNWRMKITGTEIIGKSDYAKVTVEVTAPRKRKPCVVWNLAVNIARNQADWAKSTFCNI